MADVLAIALALLPGGLWCAWWLFCVDWKKAWPVLAEGGWVGVLLLVFLSALAWSRVFPAAGPLNLPNFTWQLGACGLLAGAALFCGWAQERLGWAPGPVQFGPPDHHRGDGEHPEFSAHHGHDHGHH